MLRVRQLDNFATGFVSAGGEEVERLSFWGGLESLNRLLSWSLSLLLLQFIKRSGSDAYVLESHLASDSALEYRPLRDFPPLSLQLSELSVFGTALKMKIGASFFDSTSLHGTCAVVVVGVAAEAGVPTSNTHVVLAEVLAIVKHAPRINSHLTYHSSHLDYLISIWSIYHWQV